VGIYTVLQRFASESSQPSYDSFGDEFTLISQDGPISLSKFRGKVVVLFFGYTSCPDICPTDLARMAAAFRMLSKKELEETKGIFVSIDHSRDTVMIVSAYANFFHNNIIGLTGDETTLSKVAKDYFVFFDKAETGDTSEDYTLDHSTTTYLLDREGKVRKLIKHDATTGDLAAAIRHVLKS
tara:strand:+ start:3900 stop:4445 length:546 start_codon:yes stop_codon:yes gene_type:complete